MSGECNVITNGEEKVSRDHYICTRSNGPRSGTKLQFVRPFQLVLTYMYWPSTSPGDT